MSSDSNASDSEPLDHHPDDVLLPSNPGNVVVVLGKEAVLSWFTGVRSNVHREVADRLYELGHPRVLFETSAYPLVEAFTKVRYERSARDVARLQRELVASVIRVRHGSDGWADVEQRRPPKVIFDGASELLESRPRIECSFQEAALVLGIARENRNRSVPVYLFTFDGTLATLADTFDVPVLPFATPLRDDSGR